LASGRTITNTAKALSLMQIIPFTLASGRTIRDTASALSLI